MTDHVLDGREYARAMRLASLLAAMIAGSAAGQPVVLPDAPAGVQTFVDQGIQFSRVNAANAQALNTTGPIGRAIGGGSWDFGVSRTELTQAQWLEFTNAFVGVLVPQDQPWSSRVTSLLRGDGWVSPGIYGTVMGSQGRFVYAIDPALPNMPVRGPSPNPDSLEPRALSNTGLPPSQTASLRPYGRKPPYRGRRLLA